MFVDDHPKWVLRERESEITKELFDLILFVMHTMCVTNRKISYSTDLSTNIQVNKWSVSYHRVRRYIY